MRQAVFRRTFPFDRSSNLLFPACPFLTPAVLAVLKGPCYITGSASVICLRRPGAMGGAVS